MSLHIWVFPRILPILISHCNLTPAAQFFNLNETIKPYLAAKGNSADEADKMQRRWCKSMQLQPALWTGTDIEAWQAPNEW
jgi:hypothetical protein